MARNKRTSKEKGGVSKGFALQWFYATLNFVKDDKRASLQYPTMSHAQIEYICSLIRPNVVKTWAVAEPEYAALYEALTIFHLNFEFKLNLVDNENNNSLLLVKVPKQNKKSEDQASSTDSIESILNAFRKPKLTDEITQSYMLTSTQLILDFIEDKRRATFEITHVNPLQYYFLCWVITTTKPLFPIHSKILAYTTNLNPGQDFYLKVDVVKIMGKSKLRHVMFSKVPRFNSEPKVKTTSGQRPESASKINRPSEIVESQPSVLKTTKSLNKSLTLENECSNTVTDISSNPANIESVSNKLTSLKIESAQTPSLEMPSLSLKIPCDTLPPKLKTITPNSSTTSESTISSKMDLDSNSSFSFMEDSESCSLKTNSSISEKSRIPSILENYISLVWAYKNYVLSTSSSCTSDLESAFETRKSVLSRSVPDLREKTQYIQFARSDSIPNKTLTYEDIFGNITEPSNIDRNNHSSRNSVLKSPKDNNLVRTASVPTLKSIKRCNLNTNSGDAASSRRVLLSSTLVTSSESSVIAPINMKFSIAQNIGTNSTLESKNASRVSITEESQQYKLDSASLESSTDLMAVGSTAVLDSAKNISNNSERRTKLAEKFEKLKKKLGSDNQSKDRSRRRNSGSVGIPRKTQLIEAMSMPVHVEKSARIMKMMGYQGGPLGLRGEGITEPIMPALDLVNGAGLGYPRLDIKKDTSEPKHGGGNISNVNKVIPPLMGLPTLNKSGINLLTPITNVTVRPKKEPVPTKSEFRSQLIRSAIELINTEVATVKIPHNTPSKKHKAFVKFFLKMVNDGRKVSLNSKEEMQLLRMLKVVMKNSPWRIEESESGDNKHTILRKIPLSHYRAKCNIKTIETQTALTHSASLQYELDSGQNNVDYNLMTITSITDKRLKDYINNVYYPKLPDYPQRCTYALAFRVIILDEILNLCKSNNTSMIINFKMDINEKENKFLNNISSAHPQFGSVMENYIFENIVILLIQKQLCLDVEYTEEMRLTVLKLNNNQNNRLIVSKQRGEKCRKNESSNHVVYVNNTEIITKSPCPNMPKIYMINKKENMQIQITNDVADNIKYLNSNQVSNKKEDNIVGVNENNDNDALTTKADVINSDCVKPIVIDVKKDNEVNTLSESDKENELLKSEDDDFVIVDKVDEIFVLSDEESDISQSLCTVDKEIKSIATEEKEKDKNELGNDKQKGISEIIDSIGGDTIKTSNSSYSDLEFENDLKDFEQLFSDIDDETEIFTTKESDKITRKRSRTDSEPTHDSKKSKTNCIDFKTVTILPKMDQKVNITQEMVLKIQTIISDAIDDSNELPLLKCHGIVDDGLVYGCHDEKSYIFLKKCFSASDFTMLDSVAIEDNFYKLKIRLNTWLENVTRLFNRLELYNVGMNTENWCVTDVLKYNDHIDILTEVDSDSFKYIKEGNFSLYAGVDMARFSIHLD